VSLPLPNLDDRRFDDLVEEARSLIRSYAPEWTNHNVSDPGITLIELFAWLAEMLNYRANQVTERHRISFVRLLSPPDAKPPVRTPLDEERVYAALNAIRRRYRAVTAEDYEALAREPSPEVARAHCLPRRYLGAGTEGERVEERPGFISVIVLPRAGLDDAAAAALRDVVAAYLAPRNLLGVRQHVAEPVWAPVAAEVLVQRREDADDDDVRDAVAAELARFLDPLAGGDEGGGWPFGRDVYTSELYQLLGRLPGVDYVADVRLVSDCGATPSRRCVAATELWDEDGDQRGLGLAPHHLPLPAIDAASITVAGELEPIALDFEIQAPETVAPADVRRLVKATVRRRFNPLLPNGPKVGTRWSIQSDTIRRAVRDALQPLGASLVQMTPYGAGVVFALDERQLADPRISVEVHP
jgi:hypothetical protein